MTQTMMETAEVAMAAHVATTGIINREYIRQRMDGWYVAYYVGSINVQPCERCWLYGEILRGNVREIHKRRQQPLSCVLLYKGDGLYYHEAARKAKRYGVPLYVYEQ